MAFPYICKACLDGDHSDCEEHKGEGYGYGFCVCKGADHDVNSNKFAKSVWEQYNG